MFSEKSNQGRLQSFSEDLWKLKSYIDIQNREILRETFEKNPHSKVPDQERSFKMNRILETSAPELYAHAYFQRGQWEIALVLFNRALQSKDAPSRIKVFYILCFYLLGLTKTGVFLMKGLLELDKTNREALDRLLFRYFQESDRDELRVLKKDETLQDVFEAELKTAKIQNLAHFCREILVSRLEDFSRFGFLEALNSWPYELLEGEDLELSGYSYFYHIPPEKASENSWKEAMGAFDRVNSIKGYHASKTRALFYYCLCAFLSGQSQKALSGLQLLRKRDAENWPKYIERLSDSLDSKSFHSFLISLMKLFVDVSQTILERHKVSQNAHFEKRFVENSLFLDLLRKEDIPPSRIHSNHIEVETTFCPQTSPQKEQILRIYWLPHTYPNKTLEESSALTEKTEALRSFLINPKDFDALRKYGIHVLELDGFTQAQSIFECLIIFNLMNKNDLFDLLKDLIDTTFLHKWFISSSIFNESLHQNKFNSYEYQHQSVFKTFSVEIAFFSRKYEDLSGPGVSLDELLASIESNANPKETAKFFQELGDCYLKVRRDYRRGSLFSRAGARLISLEKKRTEKARILAMLKKEEGEKKSAEPLSLITQSELPIPKLLASIESNTSPKETAELFQKLMDHYLKIGDYPKAGLCSQAKAHLKNSEGKLTETEKEEILTVLKKEEGEKKSMKPAKELHIAELLATIESNTNLQEVATLFHELTDCYLKIGDYQKANLCSEAEKYLKSSEEKTEEEEILAMIQREEEEVKRMRQSVKELSIAELLASIEPNSKPKEVAELLLGLADYCLQMGDYQKANVFSQASAQFNYLETKLTQQSEILAIIQKEKGEKKRKELVKLITQPELPIPKLLASIESNTNPKEMAELFQNLKNCFLKIGDYQKASLCYQAEARLKNSEGKLTETEKEEILTVLKKEEGEKKSMKSAKEFHIAELLATIESNTNLQEVAKLFHELADCYLKIGDYPKASLCSRAEARLKDSEGKLTETEKEEILTVLKKEEGEKKSAEPLSLITQSELPIPKLLASIESNTNPKEMAELFQNLRNCFLKIGDYPKASLCYQAEAHLKEKGELTKTEKEGILATLQGN